MTRENLTSALMKTSSRLISLAICGLLPCLASTPVDAEPSNRAGPPMGGHSSVRMSDNSVVSTIHQWSADPEKGWVRAGERNRMRDRKDSGKFKNTSGKHKDYGVKNKVKADG